MLLETNFSNKWANIGLRINLYCLRHQNWDIKLAFTCRNGSRLSDAQQDQKQRKKKRAKKAFSSPFRCCCSAARSGGLGCKQDKSGGERSPPPSSLFSWPIKVELGMINFYSIFCFLYCSIQDELEQELSFDGFSENWKRSREGKGLLSLTLFSS